MPESIFYSSNRKSLVGEIGSQEQHNKLTYVSLQFLKYFPDKYA